MQNRYRMKRSPLRNGLFLPATNADQHMQRLPESLLWLAGLSGFAVAVTDAVGQVAWVNDKFVHDTGWAPGELRGLTPWASFLVPGNDATVAQRAQDAVAEGLPCTGLEVFSRTPRGASPCGRLDLIPVRNEQAGLTHFVCMLSDTGVGEQADDPQGMGMGMGMGLLQDLGLIGFWQRDILSGRGHWDTVCRRIWGVGNDEPVLTLDEAEQRLTGLDREALQRYRAELAASATQGEVAYTLTSPAGERHVRSLWRRSGSLVSGVLIDTTSEHTVSAERARLLQALELAAPAAQLVFWRHDLGSGAVEWLPSGQHPFSVDEQDRSRADEILARVLSEERPAVLSARERARYERDVIELEYRVHDQDGAVRHLLTRRLGVQRTGGVAAEIIGVLIDVTTQREREIALRRLTAQQALALKALRAGTFRFDLAAQEFEFDEPMRRLYALPRNASRLDFASWLQLVHPEDRPRVQQLATELFRSAKRTVPAQFRIRCPDGRALWIESDRVPELDAQGNAVALVGTHRDITGEITTRAQTRALADAELVARTRAELLATLAHELRNPLNAVRGFAQLLRLGTPGTGPGPATAALHIQNAAEMMTALLDDLSDLASADAGRLRWRPVSLEVATFLVECRAWLQQHEGSGDRIRVQMPMSLKLWADPTRTRQILLNLLTNALKYSDKEVGLGATQDGETVRIWVRDAGQGLDAGQIQRAFEPFERLGRERGMQPGSGIGLTLCLRLARMMGGDIEVVSERGVGSEFTLVLPAGAPAGQNPPSRESAR